MINTFYFPHDYDAANDDKILQVRSEFGIEGYALFFLCLETMAKNEHSHLMASLLGGLSVGYGINKDRLQTFLDFSVSINLFKKDKLGYFSPRMNEHKEYRKMLSLSGKQGAKARWKNSPPNGLPISPPNGNQIKSNQIKEKEIKPISLNQSEQSSQEEKSVNDVIPYFEPINPSWRRFYSIVPQRAAIKRLLKIMAKEELIASLQVLPQIINRPYAPRATTPIKLEEKLGEIKIFIAQEKSKSQSRITDLS